MTNKTTLVPVSELSVEPGFNVRTEKEVRENAKSLAKDIEAHGGFEESSPVTYVKRGDQKLIRKGHTRLAAAELLKIEEIPAIEVEDDWRKSLVNLVTSNVGNPLRREQQGQIYIRLRDGAEKPEAGEGEYQWIQEPMKEADIAALFHRSAEHIRQCIAICESSPEIAQLLEDGAVSANVVISAKGLAKGSDAKQLKIVKAAIAEAGGDIATKKHFDAIKPQFTELKAAGGKEKPAKEPKADDNKPQEPSQSREQVTTPEAPQTNATAEAELEAAKNELFENLGQSQSKYREAVVAILMDSDNTDNIVLDRDTCDALYDKISEVFNRPPF